MLDLLIRGGEVVTPQGVGKWSVGVQGEKIAFIGTDEHAPQAGRTIDASGKIVRFLIDNEAAVEPGQAVLLIETA